MWHLLQYPISLPDLSLQNIIGMCNTYTFYHLCGHTYLRTLISCPDAVDRAVSLNLSNDQEAPSSPRQTRLLSPRLVPLPLSAPLSPPSSFRTHEPNISRPHRAQLSPLLPPSPALMNPSFCHASRLKTCPCAPDSISIVPLQCEACASLEQIAASITAPHEHGAAFKLVETCKARIFQRHTRAASEVASPDSISPTSPDTERLRPVAFAVASGGEGLDEGSIRSGSNSTTGVLSSRTSSSLLSGHSIARSRRSGADAKARILSARKRVLRGFGPGW